MKTDESIKAGEVEAKAGPPVEAAVIGHQEDGARLMIVDLSTEKTRLIGTQNGVPDKPAWSPDGQFLAYRDGNKLMLHVSDGNGPEMSLLDNLYADPYTPYAFSPDSRLLAISTTRGPVILSIQELAAKKESRSIPMTQGCKITDLLWAANGSALWILCYPAPGREESDLLAIDPLSMRRQSRPAHNAQRLLGWRAGTDMVVINYAEDGGEQAGTLDPSGAFHKWMLSNAESNENRSEYILNYIQNSGALLTVAASEDQSDPVALRLTFGNKPSLTWLALFPRLSDLSISANGRWALFVDRSHYERIGMEGGDVYMVGVGHEDPRRVLKGVLGKLSYSSPVMRPQLGGTQRAAPPASSAQR